MMESNIVKNRGKNSLKGFSDGLDPLEKLNPYDNYEDYGDVFSDFQKKIAENEHPHYGLLDFDKLRQYYKTVDPEEFTPNKVTQILVELLAYIDLHYHCDASTIWMFDSAISRHNLQIQSILKQISEIESLRNEVQRLKNRLDEMKLKE